MSGINKVRIPQLANTHLVKDVDLSRDEILELYRLTDDLRSAYQRGEQLNLLQGKTLGMIFEKNSTRTRVSFQVGMYHLGGQAIHLSSNDIQLRRGESVEDTAKVLSRYLDAIMIRSYSQEKVDLMAANSSVPVINGLTDLYHPCQSLTDYYTMHKYAGQDAVLGFVGDSANNVAMSLAYTGSILGHTMFFISPPEYSLPQQVLQECNEINKTSGGKIYLSDDPIEGPKNCDVLYTDVWVSMGMEKEQSERVNRLQPFALSSAMVNANANRPFIMHCLPAHWGEEIEEDLRVYDRNIIYDQAENRLHVQKSVLVSLMVGQTNGTKR